MYTDVHLVWYFAVLLHENCSDPDWTCLADVLTLPWNHVRTSGGGPCAEKKSFSFSSPISSLHGATLKELRLYCVDFSDFIEHFVRSVQRHSPLSPGYFALDLLCALRCGVSQFCSVSSSSLVPVRTVSSSRRGDRRLVKLGRNAAAAARPDLRALLLELNLSKCAGSRGKADPCLFFIN